MKKIFLLAIFTMSLLLTGCDDKGNVTPCDTGYERIDGRCIIISDIGNGVTKADILERVENLYEGFELLSSLGVTADYCSDLYITVDDCSDFVRSLGNTSFNPGDFDYYEIEVNTDGTFDLVIYQQYFNGYYRLSGKAAPKGNVISLSDLDYSRVSVIKPNEEELKALLEPLLFTSEFSNVCSEKSLETNDNWRCTAYPYYNDQLDTIENAKIKSNGIVELILGSSTDELVEVYVDIQLFLYEDTYKIGMFEFNNTTPDFYTSDYVQTYFADKLGNDFTQEDIDYLCSIPKSSYDEDLSVEECNNHFTKLLDKEIDVEVMAQTPADFHIFINDINGYEAVHIDVEFMRDYDLNLLIVMNEFEGFSTDVYSKFKATELINAYYEELNNGNIQGNCATYFSENYRNQNDCSLDEFQSSSNVYEVYEIKRDWTLGYLVKRFDYENNIMTLDGFTFTDENQLFRIDTVRYLDFNIPQEQDVKEALEKTIELYQSGDFVELCNVLGKQEHFDNQQDCYDYLGSQLSSYGTKFRVDTVSFNKVEGSARIFTVSMTHYNMYETVHYTFDVYIDDLTSSPLGYFVTSDGFTKELSEMNYYTIFANRLNSYMTAYFDETIDSSDLYDTYISVQYNKDQFIAERENNLQNHVSYSIETLAVTIDPTTHDEIMSVTYQVEYVDGTTEMLTISGVLDIQEDVFLFPLDADILKITE